MGSSQKERACVKARARLERETPIATGTDLTKLEQEAAALGEMAGQESNVSFSWQAVARDFVGHLSRKQGRPISLGSDRIKLQADK